MTCSAYATFLLWLAMGQLSMAVAADYLPGAHAPITTEPGLFLIVSAAVIFIGGILEDVAADLNHRRQAWKARKAMTGSAGLLSLPA